MVAKVGLAVVLMFSVLIICTLVIDYVPRDHHYTVSAVLGVSYIIFLITLRRII